MTDEERFALDDFVRNLQAISANDPAVIDAGTKLGKAIGDVFMDHLKKVDMRTAIADSIAESIKTTLSPWWMISDEEGNGFALYVRNSDLVIYNVKKCKFDFSNPVVIPPAMISYIPS